MAFEGFRRAFSQEPLGAMSPEEVERRRRMVDALYAPAEVVTSGWGVLNEGLKGIFGGLEDRRLTRAEREGRAGATASMDRIMAAFGGGAPSAGGLGGGSTTPYAPPSGGSNYRDAIASIESGGRYDAVGPTNARLGRPLGKYQVMEANVGPWSEQVLGRRVTPEEFLASPEIQDAIFDGIFGGYVSQYGPEGAAQAWFGGPGAVGQTGRQDVLGTSVGEYGQRFMQGVGGGAPQQMAQAGGNVSPVGMQQIMAALQNPWLDESQRSILGALLTQAMTPPDPTAGLVTAGGQIYNANTGQWMTPPAGPADPLIVNDQIIDPNSLQVRGDYRDAPEAPVVRRPMTPEERQAYGVSPDDTRIIVMGPEGPEVIGGAGVSVTTNVGQGQPGVDAVDRAFADDFVAWNASGGATDIERQLTNLDWALNNLRTMEGLTGPLVGLQPRGALALTNPTALATMEAIEETVQRNLRLILGAQFTEREGERLIARAYNPTLPQEENIRRVETLIEQIRNAALAKQEASDYFRQHGTLYGYQGRVPRLEDFDAALDGLDGLGAGRGGSNPLVNPAPLGPQQTFTPPGAPAAPPAAMTPPPAPAAQPAAPAAPPVPPQAQQLQPGQVFTTWPDGRPVPPGWQVRVGPDGTPQPERIPSAPTHTWTPDGGLRSVQ